MSRRRVDEYVCEFASDAGGGHVAAEAGDEVWYDALELVPLEVDRIRVEKQMYMY